MNEEIKNCPFCGGEATLNTRLADDEFYKYITCKDCLAASVLCTHTKDAYERWNTRFE